MIGIWSYASLLGPRSVYLTCMGAVLLDRRRRSDYGSTHVCPSGSLDAVLLMAWACNAALGGGIVAWGGNIAPCERVLCEVDKVLSSAVDA